MIGTRSSGRAGVLAEARPPPGGSPRSRLGPATGQPGPSARPPAAATTWSRPLPAMPWHVPFPRARRA
jgi:hypothetical protein